MEQGEFLLESAGEVTWQVLWVDLRPPEAMLKFCY